MSSDTPAPDTLLLQALMDSMQDCVYFKDLKSRFIRVNRFMAARSGAFLPENLVGKTDFDLYTAEHAQPAYDDEQTIIRTGNPLINIEEKETFSDGHVAWVSTSKMPLRDNSGSIIGTYGISHDITEKKLTEIKLASTQKELVEASRLAGMAEISSGVLHNIGNALNSVMTSASILAEQQGRSRLPNLGKAVQMIEQHLDDSAAFFSNDPKGKQLLPYLVQLSQLLASEREETQKELSLLRRNIEHIKDIITMQQNYARMSHLAEDLAPAELVEESLHISEASLNRHGITVVKDYASDIPLVHVARHKVLQILVNFIRNAKHALDDSGRTDKELRVSVRKTGDQRIQFSVRDNGIGIPPENMSKIFTFGFTTRKHGHGFGLHSSQSAARDLGGEVKVESEGTGKGALFILELPST